MGKFTDITEKRYGKLVVKKYLGGSRWLCNCDCGNTVSVRTADLNKGHTKSCGCLLKKYNLDDTYFDNIDTQEKAYILGMFSADAAITYKPYNVKLELKSDDEDILEKIKNAMNYNFDIKHYKNKCKTENYNYVCDTSRLNITNKNIVLKLAEYGVVPRKSNILYFDFNKIPKEYHSHYLRGLWDGDGTISLNTNRKTPQPTMNLTSSTTMIQNIVKLLNKNFEINPYLYNRRKSNVDNTTMVVGRQQDIKNLLEFLYKDATIYLDRKYEKYIECKKLLSM